MKKFQTASGEPPVLHRNSANLMQSMLDEVKASITILPELQALIPPLQASEYEQLETNIKKEGCREALLIWQTTQGIIEKTADSSPLNILIDGHNRYSICTKNNVDFKVALREFPTLQAVRDFMIDNQLGRRNLTPEQMSYLRGLKYRNELTPELKQEVLKGSQKMPKEIVREIGRQTVSSEAPPLSLAGIDAITSGQTTPETDSAAPVLSEVSNLVKQIAQLANKLDPDKPDFVAHCDRLMNLLTKAKKQVGGTG